MAFGFVGMVMRLVCIVLVVMPMCMLLRVSVERLKTGLPKPIFPLMGKLFFGDRQDTPLDTAKRHVVVAFMICLRDLTAKILKRLQMLLGFLRVIEVFCFGLHKTVRDMRRRSRLLSSHFCD